MQIKMQSHSMRAICQERQRKFPHTDAKLKGTPQGESQGPADPWSLHSASLGSPGGAGGEYTFKLVEGSMSQKTVRGQSTAMRGLLKPALYPEVKVWGGTNLTVEEQSPCHTTNN